MAKAGCILLGYLAAVLLHGVWNGSALFGIKAYFGVYAFFMVPIFGLVIILAVHSRRREQRTVAAKLPGMVTAGLVNGTFPTVTGLELGNGRRYQVVYEETAIKLRVVAP